MNRLTRDGTAEPVSRDQILRHARGQGNINFPCSADHEQDWQPYPVDPYSAICDDHTYIHTYIIVKWAKSVALQQYILVFKRWQTEIIRQYFEGCAGFFFNNFCKLNPK